jgi:hypothetical protein
MQMVCSTKSSAHPGEPARATRSSAGARIRDRIVHSRIRMTSYRTVPSQSIDCPSHGWDQLLDSDELDVDFDALIQARDHSLRRSAHSAGTSAVIE